MAVDALPPGAGGTVLADGHGLVDRFVAYTGSPVGWCRARDLFLGDGLAPELERFGDAHGASSTAVAAVLLFEQYALRLAAVTLAAFHREGMLLDTRPGAVLVSPPDAPPPRLAFAGPVARATGADPQAGVSAGADLPGEPWTARDVDALRERLLGDGLLPVAEHLHRRTRAGRRTLRGVIANAVAANYLHLSWPRADRAQFVDVARAFLEPDGLAGLVGIEAVEVDGASWMYTDRNTCCLAFRTARNGARDVPYCLTCPCLDRGTTRAMFAEATASYRERHGG